MLESELELESKYGQWKRNWNRMCRNRPITAHNNAYYVSLDTIHDHVPFTATKIGKRLFCCNILEQLQNWQIYKWATLLIGK